MTSKSLEECILNPSGDKRTSASSFQDAFRSFPDILSSLKQSLSESESLRDKFPEYIEAFCEFAVNEPKISLPALRDLLLSLPVHCRCGELHTFGLEAWLKLWVHKCDCSGIDSVNECRLSKIRSYVGLLLNAAISTASKGYLSNSKESYMMSLAGQFLSKFWLPEIVNVRHKVSMSWIEANIGICRSMMSLQSSCGSDQQTQVLVEVSLRILSAQLEAAAVRVSDWFTEKPFCGMESIRGLLREFPILLNALVTKLANLDYSMQCLARERHADFELVSSDLALFLLLDAIPEDIPSPRIVPVLYAKPKRSDIMNRACLALLHSEYVAAGICVSLRAMSSFTPSASLFQKLIEIATSYGDESFMNLPNRRSVFSSVQSRLMSLDNTKESMEICTAIIERSRIDSVVGIFLKILKDLWVKDGKRDTSIFFNMVDKILAQDPYPVVDGMDTLKSLLNWARLVLLLPLSDQDEKLSFSSKINRLSSNIDAELSLLKADSEEEGIAKHRLVFIGHLVARVRELISRIDR